MNIFDGPVVFTVNTSNFILCQQYHCGTKKVLCYCIKLTFNAQHQNIFLVQITTQTAQLALFGSKLLMPSLRAQKFSPSCSPQLEAYLLSDDDRIAQLSSTRCRCGRSGVQIPGRSNRHSVANGSPPLRRFFGAVLPWR